MEFLKSIFGSEKTGAKPGGIAAVLLGTIGGYYLGGSFMTGLMGLVGGVVLAPLVNELVFKAGQHMGTITPPSRPQDFTALDPIQQLPAHMLQPSGQLSKHNIQAPFLDNLTVPPAFAVAESFKKRERIIEILTKKEGNLTEFDQVRTQAEALEKQAGDFMATVKEYQARRAAYHIAGGPRDVVINDVKESLKRKGITNPLSDDQIQRFVPTLPALTADQEAEVTRLLDAALPETIPVFNNPQPYKPRIAAEARFTKDTDPEAKKRKKLEWDAKSQFQKICYALDQLDQDRCKKYLAVDWSIVGEDAKTLPPAKQMERVIHLESVTKEVRDGDPRKIQYEALRELATVGEIREQLHKIIREKLDENVLGQPDGALGIYSKFRKFQLEPAAALAKQFSKQRLDVFNETGIAILEKGEISEPLAPEKKPGCQYMTYRDCTAAKGTEEVTLVMQNGQITHRLTGSLNANIDWDKVKLKTPITVKPDTFIKLTPENGKTIGATIRDMLQLSQAAPLSSAMLTPLQRRNFDHLMPDETPMMATRLAATEQVGAPSLSTQPSAMPSKKEKQDAFAKTNA